MNIVRRETEQFHLYNLKLPYFHGNQESDTVLRLINPSKNNYPPLKICQLKSMKF